MSATKDGDKGQGSPGAASGKEPGAKPQASDQAGELASQKDDGSSPLVPILVAILVLAAISVAAVMFRQRRQRGGSDGAVSPKAG